jgi:hypothetical protein
MSVDLEGDLYVAEIGIDLSIIFFSVFITFYLFTYLFISFFVCRECESSEIRMERINIIFFSCFILKTNNKDKKLIYWGWHKNINKNNFSFCYSVILYYVQHPFSCAA